MSQQILSGITVKDTDIFIGDYLRIEDKAAEKVRLYKITKMREHYSGEIKVDIRDVYENESTLLISAETLLKLHTDLKMIDKESLKDELNDLIQYINNKEA